MNQNEMKLAVAKAAVEHIRPQLSRDDVLGIGTGSTVDLFIDELARYKNEFGAAVASSERSAERLRKNGIEVLDLNSVSDIPFYIDGADEITQHLHMIKGGGGALTREKIVAAVAKRFVCMVDETKRVPVLGNFPLPLEVIPMARSYVARQIMKWAVDFPAMSVDWRMQTDGKPYITDNGNVILDIRGWKILNPVELEQRLNQIVGTVTNGLFAARAADVCLVATTAGVQTLSR
jgi:ribose 5-phosphate isomerase A